MKPRSPSGHYIKRPAYDQAAIDKLMWLSDNEPKSKQKKRYDAVILYLQGYEQKEIAKILHTPRRTISTHIRLYCIAGIEALLLKSPTGAPRKLTGAQEQELCNIISSKTPADAGIGVFANWTAPLICKLIEEQYNVAFSFPGIYDLLHRLGLSYTRPTYTLKKADPKKQEEFLKTWGALKKTAL